MVGEKGGIVTGCPFEMIYRSRAGETTTRRLTITRVERGARGIYLQGFCFLRGAPRGFDLSGVRSLTDMSSGEILEHPEEIRPQS